MTKLVPKKTILIHGTPRSGTSWLGQIFNSVPKVAYKYQPLFSYKYKDYINIRSTKDKVINFLNIVFKDDEDEFINQLPQKERSVHPVFHKSEILDVLVIKNVRYHNLLKKFLNSNKSIYVIGIVRHPCGVINSWLKTPREFNPDWDELEQWRDAPLKNKGRPEEFYGFDKWKELSNLLLDLKDSFPKRVHIIQYEELVNFPEKQTKDLFNKLDIDFDSQTKEFIKNTHKKEIEDPDTVYRLKDVANRWKSELNPVIREQIINEISGTNLERFLHE